MSDDHVDDVAAKAATPAELKFALPRADQGFLFEQIEKGATLAEAREAYADAREAELEEREAALVASEDAAEKEKKAAKKQPPLADTGSDADEPTFESLVADIMSTKGIDRRSACRMVAKRHKDLHEAYLDRCPEGRG